MFPSSLFYIARVTKNEKILFTTLKLCVNILDLQLSDLVKTKFDKKIEQFAKEKKIFYILNWCASIREYLTIALHDKSNSRVNYLYEKVVNIDLFVM